MKMTLVKYYPGGFILPGFCCNFSEFLHLPELLILDELTSGFGPLIQQRFYDILREENEKVMTILFFP